MISGLSSSGWSRVKFGELARLVRDRVDPQAAGLERYVAGEHMDTDDLRVRRWGTVGDGYLGPAFHMRFMPGHVLYGSRRTYLRKVAIADFEGVCANTTFVLEPKDSSMLLPGLLPFLMQTEAFHEHSKRESKGSVNPYVNFSDLEWWEFSLPPLEVQTRLLTALQACRYALEAGRQVALTSAVARRSVIWSLYQRGTRGNSLGDTPLGLLPTSWRVCPLGERYDVQLGKMMSEAARAGEHQSPYIRNANVQWNRLELDDVATMSFSAEERNKFALRRGDILACEGRHVGKAAIWRDEIPGACYQKALHRLRRLRTEDIPEYLLHCLQYYSWSGRFAADTGETTIPHLPAERLRAMLFPFPPPDEQREIADAVEACDQTVSKVDERLNLHRSLLGHFLSELVKT